MRKLALILSLAAALAAPALARAGAPVELRASPISHGSSITLGDVFDGADGLASGVVIARAAQVGLDAVLDAGAVQLAARRAGLDWANPSGFHRIVVTSAPGEAAAASPTRARIKASRRSHAAQALTYARNISAGDIIAPDDLVWSDDVVSPSDAFRDPEAAIGKAARHALRAGAPAATHDLSSPKVIKRDDTIAVVFEEDGISLTLQAKAMADAAVGDTVDVVNPQSKKVIEAVCIGPDQAVIGPRADELKADSYQPGGQGRLSVATLR